jgi:hypothetical protein
MFIIGDPYLAYLVLVYMLAAPLAALCIVPLRISYCSVGRRSRLGHAWCSVNS